MKKILLSLFVCTGFVAGSFAQGGPVADFSGNPTTVCVGQAVTWTNLTTGGVGGNTYSWLFPGANITTSTLTTPNPRTYATPGQYDVTLIATDNLNNVDTMYKQNYITVVATPTITITPSAGFVGCTITSATLTASGGTTYTWSPATALSATTGATVTASPTTSITYTVTGANANGCTSQKTVLVSYNSSPPPNAGPITGGQTTVCSGQTVGTYSVPSISPVVPNRTWTVPPGSVVTSGQGTRFVTITFGSTSGNICCTASNACGASTPSCLAITVNPTPQVGTLGTITGPNTVCANQTSVTYSIPAVANAATYNWTASGTATVTAGQGTNTVTIDFANGNSNVCVTASNSCNTSPQTCMTVTVSPNIPNIPGGINGPTTVCSGQAGVVYTVGTVTNTQVYTWTVPTGATITSGQGTKTVTITYGSSSGTVCVTAGNACGTSQASCQAITVDPTSALGAIGTINGPSAVCANQTGITYSIPAVANASSYTWTATGTATVTAGQGTNTVTIDFANGASNICVKAINNCSMSSQSCQAVSVSPAAPAIPGAITGPTTVCNGATGVAYSVGTVTNATSYTWTVPTGASISSGQGTKNISVAFGATSGTVCVTASNACGTSQASCQPVSVDTAGPVGTVGTITGPTTVCNAQANVTYSVAAVTGASTYSWTVPGTATINTGQGTNTITVTFGATGGNICVDASNSCSTSSQKCTNITVTSNAPAIPGTITGPTTVCSGQSGVIYSVGTVFSATVYTWTVPPGATVTAGQGTKNITITYGSSSGTVCVTAGNVCGTSAANCVSITVDPNSVVGPVGVISGPTAVCANQTGVTYSIASVTGASTYSWTATGTATVTAGQGTNTVTIDFAANNSNVCVTASNSCSSSSAVCQAVTVSPAAPAIPGGISGPTTVCSGSTGIVYSVSSVPNASVYTWTVPATATVTAGQGTSAATIDFAATSGTVCVTAGNACGTSAASCQPVTVDPTPAVGPVGTITGPTAVCSNQTGVTYSIASVANATSYNWTVPSLATVTSGQGTTTIAIDFGNVSGNICVDASNSCGTASPSCMAVTVSPSVPGIPAGITGPTTVCNGQMGVAYSISSVASATSYTWTAPAGGSVASGQGTTSATINFGGTSGNVCVTADNACGSSSADCLAVTVGATALNVTPTQNDATCSSCCDGSATATPSGGNAPYTYAWNPTSATTSSVTGLCTGNYTVCVTDAGGCMTCAPVTISSPNGIGALTDNGTIKVFPNPANDFIFIEGALSLSADLQVNIINVFGQKMMEKMVYVNGNFSEKINIGGLPNGVYLIEIRSGAMVRNSKIVKIQ